MKTNWLSRLLRKKTQTESPGSLSLEKYEDTYPKVSLSEEMNGCAYNLFFLIGPESVDAITRSIQAYSDDEFTLNGTQEPQDQSNKDLILKVNIFPDFGGYIVHIITNEDQLISGILQSNYAPPLPKISFPDLNPMEYGALQGNVDFWFQWLWLPYWLHISASERESLGLSVDWIEFIEERT
ncbi:hypothetical protein B6A42_26945 (plasmid) [Vibrio coralliilyticus]|nr:hypothetical protein B6A42_26945 [Vibrio coralliilyticus]